MHSSRLWPATTAAVLLALAITLGFITHRAHAGTGVDHTVWHFMVAHRRDWLTPVMVFLTEAGSPTGMWVLGLVAGAVLWWRNHRPLEFLTVLAALVATRVLIPVTKSLAGTQRPPLALQLRPEHDPSYPSGHTLTALAILGLLALILGHGRSSATRIWLAVVAVLLTVAVAVSRLYLGVHWLTDITGGALLGGVVLILAGWAYLTRLSTAD